MMITKKNFWFAAVFGLVLGGSFTLAAFAEPSASPSSTVSYPPINVGAETQYREGSLGLGDGVTPAPDPSIVALNSLFVKTNLGLDSMTVRQNATLASNVNVGGRSIISGALRVAQMSVSSDSSKAQSYTSGSEKLFFPNGTTTNLISGNTCNTVANAACPIGTVISKYDASTKKSVCRFINPVKSAGNIGNCPDFTSSVTVALTSTTSSGTCSSSRNYTATGSFSNSSTGGNVTTFYWYLKGVNDTEWTYLGSGSTKSVIVPRGSTSDKIYEILARTPDQFGISSDTEDVYSIYDGSCTSQQGGGNTTGAN